MTNFSTGSALASYIATTEERIAALLLSARFSAKFCSKNKCIVCHFVTSIPILVVPILALVNYMFEHNYHII